MQLSGIELNMTDTALVMNAVKNHAIFFDTKPVYFPTNGKCYDKLC